MTQLNDAPQQALSFLISNISHIESQVWAKKYPEITYPELIPIDNTANEWARTVTFYGSDMTGKAAFVNGRSTDVPLAEVNREKFETEVHMAAIGYKYDLEELNQARLANQNLTADKASAARRAYEELCEGAAFVGDTLKGFKGLINYTGITTVSLPNGVSGTATWATKTADEILSDVNTLVGAVWTSSNTVEMADTVLVPVAQYALIAGKRIGPDTSTTVLEHIARANIYTTLTGKPLKIRAMRQLAAAGGSGADRMMAYRRDPDVMKMHIPMPLKFLPPQPRVFEFLVPGMFRLGGLNISRPGSCRYGDGL